MPPSITVGELYQLFLDTLERCTPRLLSGSDEEVEYALFEYCCAGVYPFLHSKSLRKMERAGLIDKEIARLASALREKWLLLDTTCVREAKAVRTDKRWHDVLQLAEQIVNRCRANQVKREEP